MAKDMIRRVGVKAQHAGVFCLLTAVGMMIFGAPILFLGLPINEFELRTASRVFIAINQICSWAWLAVITCGALSFPLAGIGLLLETVAGESE